MESGRAQQVLSLSFVSTPLSMNVTFSLHMQFWRKIEIRNSLIFSSHTEKNVTYCQSMQDFVSVSWYHRESDMNEGCHTFDSDQSSDKEKKTLGGDTFISASFHAPFPTRVEKHVWERSYILFTESRHGNCMGTPGMPRLHPSILRLNANRIRTTQGSSLIHVDTSMWSILRISQ